MPPAKSIVKITKSVMPRRPHRSLRESGYAMATVRTRLIAVPARV